MTTVREATFEFLRRRGMTTMFGNPGSTELPMLAEFPDDFTYVLGLQEIVAVGMADGYAQASGRPTMVNLHTAPGVGNGMGAIFNAQANKSPLVVTAGQQARGRARPAAPRAAARSRRPAPRPRWARGAGARATRCAWSGPTWTRVGVVTRPSRWPSVSGGGCGRSPPPGAGESASPRDTR